MSPAPAQQTPLATRSATACIRCRRQKTKCLHDDNGQPCRGCVKAQQQCVFPGKVPRAPRAPVVAGLPPLANTAAQPQHPQLQHPTHDVSSSDRSDLASQLELHPSHIQDCERSLALWPFPCFHRPGFLRLLKEGHLPQTLNYAILASGARASPGLIHRFGSPGGASEFFAEKAQASIVSSMDCPSVPDVQSMCLLAMHHWGSGRGVRAYVYLGMAARMALMFLPQATSRDEDFIAAETARRTIWTCFIMDQFLSCGSGRPPAIRAQDLQIQLPCSEDAFHFGSAVNTPALNGEIPEYASPDYPKGDVGEFSDMIRIAIIWRRATSWVMDPPEDEQDDTEYHQLMTDLHQWAKSLPSRQEDSPGKIDLHIQVGNGYSFALTHSIYYCALIFLARKQLHRMGRRTGGRDTDADVTAVIDTISHASQRVTALVTTLDANASFMGDPSAPPAYPIFVLFAAYTSASTVANMILQGVPVPDSVHSSSASNGSTESPEARLAALIVAPVLEIMRKSTPVWPLAERWHQELARLSARLDAKNNADIPFTAAPVAERHDSLNQPLVTNGNGYTSPHVYKKDLPYPVPHSKGSGANADHSLPSPFMGSVPGGSVKDEQHGGAQTVAETEIDVSERDSKAFDEHLKGLGDLATLLGTDGFRY